MKHFLYEYYVFRQIFIIQICFYIKPDMYISWCI